MAHAYGNQMPATVQVLTADGTDVPGLSRPSAPGEPCDEAVNRALRNGESALDMPVERR